MTTESRGLPEVVTLAEPIAVYRSARVESPHMGRLSFWALNKRHAEWFRAWEERTYNLGSVGPARIYKGEIPAGAVVCDWSFPFGAIAPDEVEAKAEELRKLGIDWFLISEGPIEGDWWKVAVYLGDEPVHATPCGSR